jgi:hypothetical protein
LAELRAVRDEAVAESHRLRGLHSALAVSEADWDALSVDSKRALIVATVQRAEVGPGRGASRISIALSE